MKAFKQDILSAQPERLYRAWMAEFKTPFFRSYLVNQPELIQLILKERPDDFPKSDHWARGCVRFWGKVFFLPMERIGKDSAASLIPPLKEDG